ncbi:innexin unc-9-like [Limulus polyphemus]|uniref:Innexin n=1 Tax=Limulus polyphemus TaxID=6850 RepID=A0ABM1S7D6_LIMPO|nr:innexin unc-9-like [Limulus polyphemus]XP_022239542.1 innexin unc-9-like [Limulus polyphemus]XP_022239543.1 innexin unc-9-like [Limulus polyphemus]
MSYFFRLHDLIGGLHVPIDDGVDKLNRKYTLLVFLFLALPIFTKQYIGDPIQCFTPTYFTDAQARYVNSYCWTASTYYLVTTDNVDDTTDPPQHPPDIRFTPEEIDYNGLDVYTVQRNKLRRINVSYYQWSSVILMVQGVCFHLPFIMWSACAHNAGIKLRRLLKRASDIAALPPGCQQRESLLTEFVDQFHTIITGNVGWCTDPSCRLPLIGCRCVAGPSRYLALLYILVKLFYLINVGVQFMLLSAFLGKGYIRHGIEILRRLAASGDWWNSPRFPLQTLCQVRAAMQGALQTYVCRCVLPINVFNEKIYSVIWFYLAILFPLNAVSLLLWIWRTFPCNRLAFIRLCLWRTRLVNMSEVSRSARKISSNYLGWDGVFLLRLIEHNHGSTLVTAIVSKLWEFYSTQLKAQEEGNSDVEMAPMPTSLPSVAPSTSWHSCHAGACHLSHFGRQTLPSTKRKPPNSYWGKCS